jgi:signal transduction histidine kinase
MNALIEHLTQQKITVLLVDDQVIVAEAVRRMLAADPEISFHALHDGRKALALAESIRPTVILQDLIMPDADGLELLRRYRASNLFRDVPVIVLSTKEEPAVKKAAFEAGANDYLVKLPDQVEMLARIRLHSQAYNYHQERNRAFYALEQSQQALVEKNSELVQLNEKIEEATRFKSQFLANMSHEIRTPMIGVLGMADMLSDSGLQPHQKDLVDVIRTSGETLLRILNDILDLSKVESGKIELESIPFSLHDAIETSLDLTAPLAFGKGLEFGAWIDPHLPDTVIGDVTRVRQIVHNLLSNAVKFTSQGYVRLIVRRSMGILAHEQTWHGPPAHEDGPRARAIGTMDSDAPTTPNAHLIQFTVEDSGIGIPADKVNKLFEAFTQIDPSMTRRFGGTGLGLAICRNLTWVMGGRIWVESELGQGTKFHFTLALPAAEESTSIPDLSGRSALALVEDSCLGNTLTTWAEAAHLQLTVASGSLETAPTTGLDYLIIDADRILGDSMGIPAHATPEQPTHRLATHRLPTHRQPSLILLTRSRNISDLSARYPHAIVLNLPLKPRQLLRTLLASAAAGPQWENQTERSVPARNVEDRAQRDATTLISESSGEQPTHRPPSTDHRSFRVLIADDNALNRRVCTMQLSKLGVTEVLQAESGRQAVDVAQAQPSLDLILMDLHMPDLDGLLAAQMIRTALPQERQPRIIALTADALGNIRETCLQAGMDGYLLKPIRIVDLKRVLGEIGA